MVEEEVVDLTIFCLYDCITQFKIIDLFTKLCKFIYYENVNNIN
jgi:hypothetical protein